MDTPTIETTVSKAKMSPEEKKAKANQAAKKHRDAVKGKGLKPLQQWVPEPRRALLREFIKLANIKHERGDEAFFEGVAKQIVDFVEAEKPAETTEPAAA